MEISGKGLITSLGFKDKVRPHKYKKARYAIGNVSKKDILKIIRESPSSFNTTVYLSWLLHSEDSLGGTVHR